jgi:hypothetical protein
MSFNKKKKCKQQDAAGIEKCLLNEFEKALALCQGFFLCMACCALHQAICKRSTALSLKLIKIAD